VAVWRDYLMDRGLLLGLVQEQMSRIGRVRLEPGGPVQGSLVGLHRSRYRGFSVEFLEHRQYSPGDDVRYIDWRLLARSERVAVKQYQQESNATVMIALDFSGSMRFSSPAAELSKYEYGAVLAAMFCYIALKQSESTGLCLFEGHRLDWLGPSARPRQWQAVVDMLCRAEPAGEGRVAEAIERIGMKSPRRSLVVLISDFFDDLPALVGSLSMLRARGHSAIVCQVMDAAELSLAVRGQCRFDGLEGGSIVAEPSAIRKEYARQVRDFITGLRGRCVRKGINYQLCVTSREQHEPLKRLLGCALRM